MAKLDKQGLNTFIRELDKHINTKINRLDISPTAEKVIMADGSNVEEAITNLQTELNGNVSTLENNINAIREVCELFSIPVLDMFKESGMPARVWAWCENHMPDGLHPNDNGHKIIAHKLQRFLENL